jgi:hypothetical protein
MGIDTPRSSERRTRTPPELNRDLVFKTSRSSIELLHSLYILWDVEDSNLPARVLQTRLSP